MSKSPPYRINPKTLRSITGNAISVDRAERVAEALAPAMVLAGVLRPKKERDQRRRARYLIAQFCHESAHFSVTEEFASGAAYEGRRDLGNTQRGDGVRYKGGGFIQVTGRVNYRNVTEWVEDAWPRIVRLFPQFEGMKRPPDFERNPDLLRDNIAWAAIASALWWDRSGCNLYCDRRDFLGLTRRINGGTNGLAQRRTFLARTLVPGRGKKLTPHKPEAKKPRRRRRRRR